mmetsp:Transcript_19493/g.58910  ORF Transcript_19493/g.58910 Transcript_19493/m.58910 type:complete len:247 (-) Transcript_19493:1070-1810(-)
MIGLEENGEGRATRAHHQLAQLRVEWVGVLHDEEGGVVPDLARIVPDAEGRPPSGTLEGRDGEDCVAGWSGARQLLDVCLGRARQEPALFVEQGKGAHAFSSEQLDSGGIVLEFDVLPRHTLRLVLGLLEAKGIRVELCLQHLVGKVYAELFERVGLKGLEAKDIEDANEGRLDGLSALFGKRRRHGSTVSTCCGCGQLVGSGRTDELIDACDDGIKGAPVDGLSKGARRVRGLCGVERLDVHFAR